MLVGQRDDPYTPVSPHCAIETSFLKMKFSRERLMAIDDISEWSYSNAVSGFEFMEALDVIWEISVNRSFKDKKATNQ